MVKSVSLSQLEPAMVCKKFSRVVGPYAPLCRATELRLNSFARIMGVQHRSVP